MVEGIFKEESGPVGSVQINKVDTFGSECAGRGVCIRHHRRYRTSLKIIGQGVNRGFNVVSERKRQGPGTPGAHRIRLGFICIFNVAS